MNVGKNNVSANEPASRSLVALGVLSLVLASPGASQAAPQQFCTRLAPLLGMKVAAPPKHSDAAGIEWKVNLVNLGQALFGGTIAVSMAVEPSAGKATTEEFIRLHDSCDATTKGAQCKVVGPAKFTIGTKQGKVSIYAEAGEQATMEMRGTTIFCRDR